MALIRITGGMAMAARYLGYGKRIEDKSHVGPDGRKTASMRYEIDDESQEFQLLLEQTKEWKKKGNENMVKNNKAIRDEVASLREMVERLVMSQMPAKGNGQGHLPLPPPPPPIVAAEPPPAPPKPAELDMAPIGSVWKTKPWNQSRGPRWLEIGVVYREGAKWLVGVVVIGGTQRNRSMELATLLSHWDRQDSEPRAED